MASPLSDPDIRCHERFYFYDGSIFILVKQSLYCVHRSLFEMHAKKFPACSFDNSGDEAYVLEDVEQIDFDRLLACLYPRNLFVEEAETTEEWISILKLASKWGFETLHSKAISRIEQTLTSPVDMVVLGRQHDISNILLSGYATLCQDTTPLSSEEGRRLGVEDVIKIYRIRHELHDSTTASVSFDNALEKVRIFLLNQEQEDNQDLETERPDSELDDEQASECTDPGSFVTSSTSLAEEEASLAVDTYVGIGGSNSHVIGSLYEQQFDDRQTVFDVLPFGVLPTGTGLDAQTAGPIFEQRHANVSLSDDECCEFFDILTVNNFGSVSDGILQWIRAKSDDRRLYNITRKTVQRAIEEPEIINAYVLLCRKIATNLTGTFRQIAGTGKSALGKTLFCRYLGEICREILAATAASMAAADGTRRTTCAAKDRRLRLIEFLARLSVPPFKVIKSRLIVNQWIIALLDGNDEKKSATLCLLLTRAGPGWDASNRKLQACMDSCFQKMRELAQKTKNPRIRALFHDMIKYRERGWVAT